MVQHFLVLRLLFGVFVISAQRHLFVGQQVVSLVTICLLQRMTVSSP